MNDQIHCKLNIKDSETTKSDIYSFIRIPKFSNLKCNAESIESLRAQNSSKIEI